MRAIPTKPGHKLVGISRHMEPVYERLPEPEPLADPTGIDCAERYEGPAQ